MPNMSEALPVLTWAVDMAAPFALGTSFQFTINYNAQPIGNLQDGETWFGEITSLSAGKPITGMAGVIYDEASRCWLPLGVAFRHEADEYAVQFKCVLRVGRIMVITMTLGDDEEEV